ncbi:MAG: heparinase II/III domain-containing protein [Acidimicrobiales bacterium]
MTTRREIGLLVRTAAHLRPEQVAQRVRLRTQRAALARWPGLGGALWRGGHDSAPGWPPGFTPLDAGLHHGEAKEVAQGRFCFLGEQRWLGDPPDWDQAEAAQLWRFNLHYFEWAWSLAGSPEGDWAREAFAELWGSWRAATVLGQGVAWSPYVVSLRAWSLCGTYPGLVAGGALEADVRAELGRHAGFLRAHLELDVGGNHLIKNLKALIGLGVFLGRADLVRLACRHLTVQLPVQVLGDGGHFERSPSYHCQVLGDLIDIAGLLEAAGEAPPPGLHDAVVSMRRWLGAILGAEGEVPLLNDAVPVGAAHLEALAPAPPPPGRVTVLGASGYVVVRPDERSQAVLDVGDPCPDDLPAHAHADCLSFELWLDGERVVVDTGTSTYESGPRRAYERSTAAHNTVEVDGEDQTEVWGAFRAARRARGHLELIEEHGDSVVVVASHNGYRRLAGAPVHRRRWSFTPGHVDVEDTISGRGRHRLVSRLYLTEAAAGRIRLEGRGGEASEEQAGAAWGFGHLRPVSARVLSAEDALLPHTLRWSVTWGDRVARGGA